MTESTPIISPEDWWNQILGAAYVVATELQRPDDAPRIARVLAPLWPADMDVHHVIEMERRRALTILVEQGVLHPTEMTFGIYERELFSSSRPGGWVFTSERDPEEGWAIVVAPSGSEEAFTISIPRSIVYAWRGRPVPPRPLQPVSDFERRAE